MTVSMKQFYGAHPTLLDPEKVGVISSPRDAALFVVAGPGTGKTACLSLRVLKLIYVDKVDPRGIIATTFTRKAAAELRSRILGWGSVIRDNLLKDKSITGIDREWVEKVDVNQIFCGTIDSLCDRLLTEHRPPGAESFSVVDDYVNRTLLLRESFLFNAPNRGDDDIDRVLQILDGRYSGGGFGWNLSRKTKVLNDLCERIINDRVDTDSLLRGVPRSSRKGFKKVLQLIADHEGELRRRGVLTYGGVAQEVLRRLKGGQLKSFTESLSAVLVDEYQDTNLLQEQLYFELAKATSGAITVVGDDDQSLYRFRGATVELFSEFPSRYRKVFKGSPNTHFLRTNYRSTKNIVNFVNNFVILDRGFQAARVARKPPLVCGSSEIGAPILGMFRETPGELAQDLAGFIRSLITTRSFRLPDGNRIVMSALGAPSDIALLSSSVEESTSSGRNRLPLLLRNELSDNARPIDVFNPRGRPVASIGDIQLLIGLILKCIDPDERYQRALKPWKDHATKLQEARSEADKCLKTRMSSTGVAFVEKWSKRSGNWPKSTSLLELVYALSNLLPNVPMRSPEFQVYLEVVTRQIDVLSVLGNYRGQIRWEGSSAKDDKHVTNSVKEIIRDAIIPILMGEVDVDEELTLQFPKSQIPILTIHQSKGLEFPVTIVDIGSDFRKELDSQAFKRFPSSGGPAHAMEDELRAFSPLSTPKRVAVDRAFDDLIRQTFVAVSRPESVLLLVGLKQSSPNGVINNIAAGYDRQGVRRLANSTTMLEL